MNLKNVNISKLAPWNWFKKEQEQASVLPVRYAGGKPAVEYPLQALRHEIDQLFNDFFRGFGLSPLARSPLFPSLAEGAQWFKPNLDISATDKEYTLQVELPGISEKDVQVEVSGDTLKIWGEKKLEKEDKGRDYYVVERSYGSFQRVLALPEDAKTDAIEARFKNGVMTITIPRIEAASQSSKKIEVKAA
ncbi:MAG: Hsp20/alpha crystallin family protein [Candidatus Sumerlaeia bacterium]